MKPDEMLLMRAHDLARHAHEGQRDKAGQPYFFTHIIDVAGRLPYDAKLRSIAYLHDVVEDTRWSLDALMAAGFGSEIVGAVDAITHRPNEPRDDYYARVKANPLALRVKLADIASNTDPPRMALLDDATRERLAAKYAHALEVLLDNSP